MPIAFKLCRASIVGLVVAGVLIPVHAREAPQAPPAQEQPAQTPQPEPPSSTSTIFGPVRRVPLLPPGLMIPASPQPGLSLPRFSQRGSIQPAQVIPAPQVGGERPICLRSVPVNPNIDSRFVQPVPDFGPVIRRVVPPPCVPTAEPVVRP